jgi:hypothetical protein
MKYWKNGFYLEQSAAGDRYEITDEYHLELLEGQSNGNQIKTDAAGRPYLSEPDPPSPERVQAMQNAARIKELEDWFVWYDRQVTKSHRDSGIDLAPLHIQANNNAAEINALRGES